jgi:hypothetical protein
MLLPILAIAMSVIALASNYDISNILAFIVSLIGIAAGVTYFLKSKVSSTLLQIWIYAQIPAISNTVSSTLENGTEMTVEHHYLDAGQAFTCDVGMTLGTKSGDLDLRVNVLPFGLLILFRLLQVAGLIGGLVTIQKFRQDNKLGDVFPLAGTAVKRATLGKEKHWLLVELASSLVHSGRSYSHLLVTAKDGETYKRGKEGKVSYLVLVSDPSQVHDGVNKKEDFQFVDWGLVSIGR